MKFVKLLPVLLPLALISFIGVTSADAQVRRGGSAGGRAVPRTAAPRVARPFVGGRVVGIAPYRSFYYRPGFSIGFYAGYPFGFGYPYYSYPYYSGFYGYPYGGFGYVSAVPAYSAYGGVRIQGAPRDAQVFADGYYAGIVDDFDGSFQHLDLTPGAHRIEIRVAGAAPITFDVQIQPGQTITYHADLPRN